MSRPVALGLVLLVLILTSQSDWKQEPKVESEATSTPAITKPQNIPSSRQKVKKEIILIQEKEIHNLKRRVQSLEEQLEQCQCDAPKNITGKTIAVEDSKHEEMHKNDSVEPLSVKASKLRGSVSSLRGAGLSEHPAKEAPGLPSTSDGFEMAEEEEEKIEDR